MRADGGIGLLLHLFLLIILVQKLFRTSSGKGHTVNRHLFKLIADLHPCHQNILFVSSGLDWSSIGVEDADLAYLETKDFLFSQIFYFEKTPRCIVLLPNGGNTTAMSMSSILVDLIHKVNSELRNMRMLIWKPIILLIWPEVLAQGPKDMDTDKELKILQNTFKNTTIKINFDIYTVFMSTFVEPLKPTSTSGSSSIHPTIYKSYLNASVWEIYTIKTTTVFQMFGTHRIKAEENESRHRHFDELTNKVGRRSNFLGEIFIASTRVSTCNGRMEQQDGFIPDIFVDFLQNLLRSSGMNRSCNESDQLDWISIKIVDGKETLDGGFSVSIYWDLMTMLNFSEGLVPGGGFVNLPNNTLAGKSVGLINSGKADISLSQSLVVRLRAEQLTFLQPTYFGVIHVFFKQPPASSIRNIVTAPFQSSLWLTLIGTWLFLIISVKISTAIKKKAYDAEHLHRIRADADFSNEVGMWAIAAICQKSWNLSPSSTPMKMAFIIGLFSGVVTYVAYSAAIVSTLAVNHIPVQRFSDLLNFKFLFTVHRSSDPFQQFLRLMIESLQLRQEIVRVSTEVEISHLMDPLKPRAFLTYPDLFYQTALQLNYSEKFVCDHISKVRVSDVLYKSAMYLKKGSEFTEIINHKLIILKERGYNFRYHQKYERKNVVSCVSTEDSQVTIDFVNFSDVFTAFLVIFVGLFFSSLVILLELLFHKITGRSSSRDLHQEFIRP